MSRRSFTSTMRMIARAAAQTERARQQAEARQRSAAVRQLRDNQRKTIADAKESARLYLAGRLEEAEEMSREVQQREAAILGLLVHGLKNKPAVSLIAVAEPFKGGIFDDQPWQGTPPNREDPYFQPTPMGFFSRVLPGAAKRRQKREEIARTRFEAADAAYQKYRWDLSTAFEQFEAAEGERRAAHDRSNAAIDEFYRKLSALDHASVIAHYKLVLERSLVGDPDAVSAEVGYSPDSKHLVVDLELPEISAVPEESAFRYVKAGDRIDPVLRPAAKRKALYANLLYQVLAAVQTRA